VLDDSEDSSGDEDVKKKRVISDADESETTDEDDDWNENGEQKVKKKKKPKPETTYSDSDSDSDTSGSLEFNDGFDSDLKGGESDCERLENMTEKKREEVLFERAERREAMRKRFEIEKKIRERTKAEKREKRRQKRLEQIGSQSDEDSDDAKPLENVSDPGILRNLQRKSKQADALSALKSEKARKEKERKQKKDNEKKSLRPSDVFSSGSDDSDGDKKYLDSDSSDQDSDGDRRGRSPHSEDDHAEDAELIRRRAKIETRDDLKIAKISRFRMAQWLHMPWFKRTVIGCYVRVNIGAGESPGKITYRIAEIRDCSESSKVYMLDPGDNSSARSSTNKQVLLRIGKIDRNFRLCFISNNDWTDNEFSYWKKQVEGCGSLPTHGELENAAKKLEQAKKHVITDQEIEVMVKEKNKHRAAPVNFATKKTTLIKLRDAAETDGNLDQVAEIQNELDRLEEQANRLNRERQKDISGITYINDRIKAALRKKDKVAEEEWRAFKDKKVDPFTRRQTAPILVSNTNNETKAQIKDVLNERYTEDIDMHYESLTFIKEKKEEEQKKKSKVDSNDLYNAHDFDIEIDMNMLPPSGSSSSFGGGVDGSRNSLSASRLSLQDYKMRNNM